MASMVRPRGRTRRPYLRGGRGAGNCARALHDLPSQRHERRSHRRPPGRRGAGALSPSAGPVRLRSDSGVDEPPPQCCGLSRHRRARARARGPISPFRRISSSAIRARPTPISTKRSISCALWASPRPTPSNIPPGPERPRPRWAARSTRRSRSPPGQAPGSAGRAAAGFQPRLCRPSPRGAVREAWPHAGSNPRPLALYAGGVRRRPAVADRRHGEVEIVDVMPNSLRGRVVSPTS